MSVQIYFEGERRFRGYKAFLPDLTCRGFQYEVGKTYELERGDCLEMCCCGFHFCRSLSEVFWYYDPCADTRICEVEALGDTHVRVRRGVEAGKLVTSRISIIREMSRDEIMDKLRKEVFDKRISDECRYWIRNIHNKLLSAYGMLGKRQRLSFTVEGGVQ